MLGNIMSNTYPLSNTKVEILFGITKYLLPLQHSFVKIKFMNR